MENFGERVKEACDVIMSDTSPNYSSQPIPSELDGKIDRLIRLFIDAPETERQHFFEHSNEDFSWGLILFAQRMASLAVREKSRDRIVEGLLALLIEDYRVDWRDNLTRLAVLYDAANKIGVSPEELFVEAASFAHNEVVRQALTEFPKRKPSNRSLEAFFYREAEGPDGFRYERYNPWERK